MFAIIKLIEETFKYVKLKNIFQNNVIKKTSQRKLEKYLKSIKKYKMP